MRRTTEEERREFERDFRAARPIRARLGNAAAKKAAASSARAPQARLDLHGMTQGAAHRALAEFLLAAAARDLRLVLIVTGKGSPRPPDVAPWTASPHGALKAMVPRWLAAAPLAHLVSGMEAAPRRQGGEGALYVRLRKKKP